MACPAVLRGARQKGWPGSIACQLGARLSSGASKIHTARPLLGGAPRLGTRQRGPKKCLSFLILSVLRTLGCQQLRHKPPNLAFPASQTAQPHLGDRPVLAPDRVASAPEETMWVDGSCRSACSYSSATLQPFGRDGARRWFQAGGVALPRKQCGRTAEPATCARVQAVQLSHSLRRSTEVEIRRGRPQLDVTCHVLKTATNQQQRVCQTPMRSWQPPT